MTDFTPTPEQTTALDLFSSGLGLAIEAGAGCGKTATLQLLAESTGRRGQYLAFNRAIVLEAQEKFPRHVTASTTHSVAFRAFGHKYAHRLNSGRVRSDEIARLLDIGPHVIRYGQQSKVLQPGYLGSLVMRAVERFCQSADDAPERRHVPYVEGIDMPDDAGNRTWDNNDRLRDELVDQMRHAWSDLLDPDGRLPYKHAHYLKAWQLSDPRIDAEFILFDEAQDAAPVTLAAIEAQVRHGTQLVFVGDSNQQVYGFIGAVNALAKVPAEARAFLTLSFRFGRPIADVANRVLGRLGAELRLSGLDSIDSRVITAGEAPDPDCVLARSNACAVSTVLDYQREGRRPHLVGGGTEVVSFARAAGDLMAGARTSHPELACFSSWGEVVEYTRADPQGDELALLVQLVEEYGVETILRALDRMPPEDLADVVVSTAHKAKGREWPTVRLAADFAIPAEGAAEEWRLLYVSATRAQRVLDLTVCQPLRELIAPTPTAAATVVEA